MGRTHEPCLIATLRRIAAVAMAVALLVVFASAATTQGRGGPKPAHSSHGSNSDLEQARERWQQLSPAQREELRRRFEDFRRLGDDERQRLRGRFERLGRVQERAVEALPEPVRRELDALAPPQRGEVLRDVAAEHMSEHVRDVLEMMPRKLKDEYAAAPQERRVEMVREFGRMLHDRARDELFRLGRELDLPRERVEQIAQLEPRELGRTVLDLRRQSIQRMIAARGLPPFVSAEQWVELQQLDVQQFMRRWSALHGRHEPPGGPGGPPPGAERRDGPPHGEPAGPRGEFQHPRDGERRPFKADDSQRGRRLRELREAVRPDPSWFVELSKVRAEERRRMVGDRVRERVLSCLEGAPELMAPPQLERLRALKGHEFHHRLHELLPELGEPGFLRDERGRPDLPPRREGPGGGRPDGEARPGGGGRAPAQPPGGAPRKPQHDRPR